MEILLATAIWGSSFFVVKDAVISVNPSVVVAYRFLIAAVVFLAIGLALKKNPFGKFVIGIGLGAVYSLAYIFQTIGLVTTSSAHSSFITGLFVFTTPLFSYLLFRTVPKKKFIIAVLCALAGLWILTGGITDISFGDAITFIVPFSVGLYGVLLEKYVRHVDMIPLLFQQSLVIGIAALIVAVWSRASLAVPGASIWYALGYLALFPAALSAFLQADAQKYISANRAGIISSLEPVFASVFAWWLGHEYMDARIAVGGLLIVIATVLNEAQWTARQGSRHADKSL